MTETLKLPCNVYEHTYRSYIQKLCNYDNDHNIEIDITNCDGLTPFAILYLLGKVKQWNEMGKRITLIYFANSDIYRYLQRMNFFRFSNFEGIEKFDRHTPGSRFMPIVEFGWGAQTIQEVDNDLDNIADIISNIFIPQSRNLERNNALQFGLNWACGELIMNADQHSKGTSYAFAQYYSHTGLVRISIMDSGMGIRESFRRVNSPHLTNGMNDLDAIEKALEFSVSSKPTGKGHVNAGVGLTYLMRVAKLAGKDMTIISKRGVWRLKYPSFYENGIIFDGTICSITLNRNKLYDFAKIF